jgi:hypothetical protein
MTVVLLYNVNNVVPRDNIPVKIQVRASASLLRRRRS